MGTEKKFDLLQKTFPCKGKNIHKAAEKYFFSKISDERQFFSDARF